MNNKSVEAWKRFCDQMKATGERLLTDDFPNQTGRDRAEGVRHVSRISSLAINQFIEFNDTEFPRFLRQNDDVTQWGGNNLDNGYLIAHIDENSTYKIYGNASSASGFILSCRDGYMHQDKLACRDLSSADMQIEEDGNFEVIVSREKQPGNWLEMIPGATQLGVRVYYYDWEKETPPVFQIVKIGNEGKAPGPITEDDLVQQLSDAGKYLDDSIAYWNQWMKDRIPFLPINAVTEPHPVPGGSNEVITYSGGRYDLKDDEALVVTFEPIKAEYLGFMLYTDAWFETIDMHNRLGGHNNFQLSQDSDDHIRVVISAQDPGVKNWIDNESRGKGLMTLRTINGDKPPVVHTQVVKVAELKDILPADTKWVTEEERKAQVMIRREHMVSRFHR